MLSSQFDFITIISFVMSNEECERMTLSLIWLKAPEVIVFFRSLRRLNMSASSNRIDFNVAFEWCHLDFLSSVVGFTKF